MKPFDRLFAQAAPLIRKGLHQPESPPVDGGRWAVSVVLRPDHASAERLEEAMTEAELYAGPGHFRTGVAGSVHFTVRSLELYREIVGEQDKAVTRYARAFTRGSVMACAHPVDDSADKFMDQLKDELAGDAWFEAGFRRDIWYATVLHFAADVAEPARLVEWVEQRRVLDLGRAVVDAAELVRFRYEDGADGILMRPEVLATARTCDGNIER